MITTNRNKPFAQNSIYLPDIETETIDGKRYYKTPYGPLPSVTTVLGEKLHNQGIADWKARVGEEEARKVSTQAAGRGTAVHELCEKYLRNDPDYKKGAMPFNLVTFGTIKKHLDLCVGSIYAMEVPLYSKKLGTAGRTDLLAGWLGVNSVVDFKTSKRLKKEDDIESYFLQATCYSMMAEELTELKFPQIVIIIAVDHEDIAQVFVKQRDDYVDKVLKIFA